MTKRTEPNPQPTSDTPYSIYLWPRSKDQQRQAVYDRLHDLGWRYDADSVTFWTPEGQPEAFGRLETDPECEKWARVVRPSTGLQRGETILELDLSLPGLIIEVDWS